VGRDVKTAANLIFLFGFGALLVIALASIMLRFVD
jgi:hypothetical protein